MAYDEFGREVENTNPGFQPFGYAGGVADDGTGQVHFGSRQYVAGIGRWVTVDAIGLHGGVNTYAYVANDPINWADPSGLCRIDVGFKEVAFGGYHAYVLTTDPNGFQMAFRGGPERDNVWDLVTHGFDPGWIVTQAWPYRHSLDFPAPGERHLFVNVLEDGCPCDPYKEQFRDATDIILAAGIEYRALGPNSNTVASVILLYGGFFPPAPPGGIWAPGYFPGAPVGMGR